MSARAGHGSVTVVERRPASAPPADPGRPWLNFDFGHGPREAAPAPAARPSSVKEAIIRWLEQQL